MLVDVMLGKFPSDVEVIGLDDSKIDESYTHPLIASLPCEIRKGRFNEARLYDQDLRKGSVKTYRNKIMFLGLQAVGKTSLCNTMLPLHYENSCYFLGLFKRTCEWELLGPNLIGKRAGRIVLSNTHVCEKEGATLTIYQLVKSRLDKLNPQAKLWQMTFRDEATAAQWYAYISHWTHNSSTDGIITKFHNVKHPTAESKLDLCFMDFAGQAEFVNVCVFMSIHHSSDSTARTNTS